MAKTSPEPLKSKVRFLADLTEGQGFSTFANTSAKHTREHRALRAFAYREGQQGAAIAGYGTTTKMSKGHTNLDQPYRVPRGAIFAPTRLMILPDGYLCKPKTITDANTTVDDSDGMQQRTNDLDGKIYRHVLMELCAAYRPVLYVDKDPIDLLSVAMLGSDQNQVRGAANGAWIDGPSFDLRKFARSGWVLKENTEFYLEFELTRDVTNHKWDPAGSGAAEAPGTTIRTALGYAAAGAAPGAGGVVLATLDVAVVLWGEFNRP